MIDKLLVELAAIVDTSRYFYISRSEVDFEYRCYFTVNIQYIKQIDMVCHFIILNETTLHETPCVNIFCSFLLYYVNR